MENKEKRLLKQEPKLKVELNEEQKEVISKFYQYDVNFILGDFGSGKSLAAVYAAVSSFRKKQFNKIWITRPILKNNLSTLPGDIDDKMFPYIFPILQNLEVCQGKETTTRMRKSGDIEIMPISVAKGVTFMESVVIVDEFQDMDYTDFRTILTRLGKGSKIIFCGSKEQIDKSVGKDSCYYTIKKLEESGLVSFTTLTANHRNPILTDIISYLEKNE
jgi:phosphate starvation-inducible PhoH-like protein